MMLLHSSDFKDILTIVLCLISYIYIKGPKHINRILFKYPSMPNNLLFQNVRHVQKVKTQNGPPNDLFMRKSKIEIEIDMFFNNI